MSNINELKFLQLDSQLCFALYSTSRALTKIYQPLLKKLSSELTYPQYLGLLAGWEKDKQTVGELCEMLLLDTGTLTPLLKRMETAGWLLRQRSDADERVVKVSLSKKAQRLQAKALAIPPCIIEASCSPHAELMALTRRIQVLREQLLSKTV